MSAETLNSENDRPKLRKWLQMGIELEGAWDEMPQDVAARVAGAKAHHDGSVSVNRGYKGEIVTRPHKRLDDLTADLERLYPPYSNDTCGFHIHASFSPLDTSCLADRQFYSYFRRRWEAWGNEHEAEDAFWDRFLARTDRAKKYCANELKIDDQLRGMHQARYTAFNLHSWTKYRTVECRFLPVFKSVSVAIAAVRELSDIYDTYLNETPWPTIHMIKEIVVAEHGVVKEKFHRKTIDRSLIKERLTRPGFEHKSGKNVFYQTKALNLMLPWVQETDVEEGLPPVEMPEDEGF